jgi:uncharacterized protein (TIGR02271 family)
MGLFDNREHAHMAIQDLRAAGVAQNRIDLRMGDQLISQYGAGSSHEDDEGFWAGIRRFFGMSDERITDRGIENLSPGDALVIVHADDELAERAADILDEHGALDVDERRATAPHAGEAEPGRATTASGQEQHRIPVVEEELRVGKRPVSRGGVRIYTRTVERPAEKDVTLRDERVDVERRPVDRPVSAASEGELFKANTYEVRESTEEPVVEKRARVKEEVNVRKEPRQRKETVRETVRGTDVRVESLSPEEQREFDRYQSEFQSDWQAKYSRSGLTYAQVLPGYQYGYHLGHDPRYSTADWSEIEPKVKRDWDARGHGPWERFKDAVRSGWERGHRH